MQEVAYVTVGSRARGSVGQAAAHVLSSVPRQHTATPQGKNIKASEHENPTKRKAPEVVNDATKPHYATYKEYYEKKYGLYGLSTTMPLMQVKGFSLHTSAVNYLMPPSQGTRHRELRRMAQHRAIAKTLYTVSHQNGGGRTAGPRHGAGGSDVCAQPAATVPPGAGPMNDSPDGDLSVLSWKGPKLIPELCSVHPLQLSVWRALQFIPSLIYRLEVGPQKLAGLHVGIYAGMGWSRQAADLLVPLDSHHWLNMAIEVPLDRFQSHQSP